MYIDRSLPHELEKRLFNIFDNDNRISLSERLTRWQNSKFGFDIFGFKANMDLNREFIPADLKIINSNIENELSYLLKNKYIIIIDEIDEDYTEKDVYKKSFNRLMVSLIKASLEINNKFNKNLCVSIFLREDIYWSLNDQSKPKWLDFVQNLNWNVTDIQKIIAHRLNLVCKFDEGVTFSEMWASVFPSGAIAIGERKIEAFPFVQLHTQNRPRDFIRYLKLAAANALARDQETVAVEDFRAIQFKYSMLMKEELITEITFLSDKAVEIFDAIQEGQKIYTDYQKFKNTLIDFKVERNETDILRICEWLYKLAIFGHVYHGSKNIFIYDQPATSFSPRTRIQIHRCLHRVMNLT